MSMKATPQAETKSFGTDVKRLMHLVTHSLYSNAETFLRELVSNSSDAIEKLRTASLNDSALLENNDAAGIWVSVDTDQKTITVRDNGIGMTRDEVIENLGNIAQSGTRQFIDQMGDKESKESSLIGQFGVGFYAAFIVAEKVLVRTRRAGMQSNQGVQWQSDGCGEYTVSNMEYEPHGTEVILYIKDEHKEFLQEYRLRTIINKYSDHLLTPIYMPVVESAQSDDKDDQEGKEKKEAESTPEWEKVNQAEALWTLPKSKIKDEQYQALYKHLSHDYEDAMAWAHNKVEGKLEYTSLLYIPKRAPMDLWQRDMQRGLKLYVRKVFIMDDAEQFLPMYLRFIRGVVDTNDLPLNVSRELLQSNDIVRRISTGCTKRSLDLLEKIANNDKEKYQEIWSVFGQVLKEGPAEDMANRERIAKLLRFHSTASDSDQETVSLTDYVDRMKADQDKIYYLIADSYDALKGSPLLEAFRQRDIEVLLMHDRVDEWLMGNMTDFDGKTFVSIDKGELDLPEGDQKVDDKSKKETEKTFSDVLKNLQEILGESRVKAVRLTDRLTESPSCVVFDAQDASGHLQRLMAAAGQAMPTPKPILELNPEHPLVSQLPGYDKDALADWAEVLLGQALLAEGSSLAKPQDFIKKLNALLK